MIFIFGPLYSGKRAAAMSLLDCTGEELASRAVWDVQNLAAEADGPGNLEALADRLSRYDAVIATETGGGVVPVEARDRAAREAAGRLNVLLAARAEAVVRVFCGIPVLIAGTLPEAGEPSAGRSRTDKPIQKYIS